MKKNKTHKKDEYEHRCAICGRKLKTWSSVQRKMGSTCERKYINELNKKQMKMEDLENV